MTSGNGKNRRTKFFETRIQMFGRNQGNGSQTQTEVTKLSIKDNLIKQFDGINSNAKITPSGYQTRNGSQTQTGMTGTGNKTFPRPNKVHERDVHTNQQSTNITSKNTDQNPKINTVDINNSKANNDKHDGTNDLGKMKTQTTNKVGDNIEVDAKETEEDYKMPSIESARSVFQSCNNGNGSQPQTEVTKSIIDNSIKQLYGIKTNVKTTPPNRDQTFPRQNNGYGSDVHKNKQSTNISNKNTDQNSKNNSIDINNSKVNNGPGESVTSWKKQEYTGNDQFNKTDKKQDQSKETNGNKKNIFENGGNGGATLNFKTSASGKNVGSSKVKELLVGNVERNTSSTQPIYNVKKSVTHNKQGLSGEGNNRLDKSSNKQEQQNRKVDIIIRNEETSDAGNKKAHTKNICNNTSTPITNNITSPVKQNEKNINAPTIHASRSFTDEISEKVKSFSGDKGDPEFFQIDEALTIHNTKINNEMKYLASLKRILKLKKSGNDTSNAKLHNFTNHKSDQLNKFKERVSKFIIDPQDHGLPNELDTFMKDKLSELSKSKDLQTELGTKANQNKLKVSSLKKYKQILNDVQTDNEELRRELNSFNVDTNSDYTVDNFTYKL